MPNPDHQELRGLHRLVPDRSHASEVARQLGTGIFGQDEALTALAGIAVQIEAGMSPPNKPRGVLMLLGPTGTGKTQALKDLGAMMLGKTAKDQLKIIDCGEYQDGHLVNRLLGSPNGYVGYGDPIIIGQKFLQKPNMIVFDEIEKADDDLPRLLLGPLADGRLTVSHPVENPDGTRNKSAKPVQLNFQQTIFGFTSNVGAFELARSARGVRSLGFRTSSEEDLTIQNLAVDALRRRYAHIPEFLGRFDEPVVFRPLQDEQYQRIFDKFMVGIATDFRKRIKKRVWLDVSDDLRSHIFGIFDRTIGARGLERTMNALIRTGLSEHVLEGYSGGNKLVAHIEDGQVVFYTDQIVTRSTGKDITVFRHDESV